MKAVNCVMLPNDFNETPLNERAKYLWDNGMFLEFISEYYNHKVALYSLHNYYVEVYINSLTDEIELIQAIPNEDLQKFLGRIKLDVF